MSKNNLTWGRARVEFAALHKEIQIFLEKEYSKMMLYSLLSKDKKISMSYRRFCELVCKYFPEKAGKSNNISKNENKNENVIERNEIIKKMTNETNFSATKKEAKPMGRREKGQPFNKNI